MLRRLFNFGLLVFTTFSLGYLVGVAKPNFLLNQLQGCSHLVGDNCKDCGCKQEKGCECMGKYHPK